MALVSTSRATTWRVRSTRVTSRTTTWRVDGDFILVPPIVAAPTIPAPSITRDPTIHALVGAQYGDLEFDAGKSVRWTQWFADTVYITDINSGDQRYWVINWTASFPEAYHGVTNISFFASPTQFRAEQFAKRLAESHLPISDDDWVLFVDASEGMSCDANSLPNDISSHPFRSFVAREVARAVAAGQVYASIPFFVFLRHVTQNITYPHKGGTPIDPDVPTSATFASQPVAVPYYLPYQGLKRLWKVSALKAPGFDWTQLDQPSAPSTGCKLQIVSYAYAHWNIQDIQPDDVIPAYLTGTQGHTASTPDPGPLPSQFTFVYKVLGPDPGTYGVLAAQWEDPPRLSWDVTIAVGDHVTYLVTSADGTTPDYAYTTGPDPTGMDQDRAISLVMNNGAGIQQMTEWASLDKGATWQVVATRNFPTPVVFDSDDVVRIGAGFRGRIYSVELRSGVTPTTGSVLWRFDASEYPGTGTSYTDPMGRIWTLTSATAIVPSKYEVPALALANDDGWRMRKLISKVRPVTGVPFADAQWNPTNDPAGTAGPWGFAQPDSPDPIAGTPAPPTVPATTAGILTPLYDLTFRINLRDGLFYAGDSLGNIPLQYDNATDTWVPVVPPEDWHETDTYVAQGV